jgi:pSer/pThr/pTyr-binding forkhead associated (FHA) protein
MDDALRRPTGVNLTLHDVAAPFVPLRLVLQPSGMAVELTQPDMVIGRHSTADLRLPLPDVSRRHCRFVYAEGVWQLFDLDSMNGVFVNGERVRRAMVRHKDIVGIGGFQFEVNLQGGPPAAPLPSPAPSPSQIAMPTLTDSLMGRALEVGAAKRKAS